MITRASRSESKRHELSSSSRSLPLNDSIQAFCHGEPGSTKSEPAPLNRHQSQPAGHAVSETGPQPAHHRHPRPKPRRPTAIAVGAARDRSMLRRHTGRARHGRVNADRCWVCSWSTSPALPRRGCTGVSCPAARTARSQRSQYPGNTVCEHRGRAAEERRTRPITPPREPC
jgi:hypothetical protein